MSKNLNMKLKTKCAQLNLANLLRNKTITIAEVQKLVPGSFHDKSPQKIIFNHYLSDFDENWCMALSYGQTLPVKILDFYDQQFLSCRGIKFCGKQKKNLSKIAFVFLKMRLKYNMLYMIGVRKEQKIQT